VSNTVTAKVVPETQRLAFLPKFFGERLMLRSESCVYSNAALVSEDYGGGLWNFYELSNGGFYLAPAGPERFNVTVQGNGYKGEVSADGYGVIVTLFVLGSLCWMVQDEATRDRLSDHYHQLREFADSHGDGAAIFRAID
jgi:Antirestriction protein